jgi:hypothetical protein
MIWLTVALWAVSLAVSSYLARQAIQGATAAGRDDLRVPTTDASRPVPVVFGRALVRAPNLVWYGDFRAQAIKEKVRVGIGPRKRVTVGHVYYLGWHYVVCLSPARVVAVRVEGETILDGITTPGAYPFSAPDLFGGKKNGGGMWGTLDVLDGAATQTPPQYLVDRLGEPHPAYRGVTSVVARQIAIGETPQMRPIAFLTQHYPDPLGEALHVVVEGDANPAWVILAALTDADWGLGHTVGRVDVVAFRAAAATLAAEGQGFSFEWHRQEGVEELIRIVLEQIDAVVYDDPLTGQWTISLNRADYVFAELPVLDRDTIVDVHSYTRPALADLPDTVHVDWMDHDAGQAQVATAHDLGLTAARAGRSIETTIRHPGCPRAALAAQLAERELGALTRGLARAEVTVQSEVGITLRRGMPVRWQWPEYGVTDLVMRVADIAYGDLLQSAVRITLVEDVFRAGVGLAAPPPPTEWQPIAPAPAAITQWVVEPITWWQTQAVGADWAIGSGETAGSVIAAAPSGNALDYDLEMRTAPADPWEPVATECLFAPRVTADGAVTPAQTVIPVVGLTDAAADSVDLGSLVWMGGELCRLDALNVGAGTVTLGRGCVDTVAQAHATGTPLYLADAAAEGAGPVLVGDHLTVRAIPLFSTGRLDAALAGTQTLTDIEARHLRPYPPGRLRFNGSAYPAQFTGDLAITWAHRDRLTQGADLIAEGAASIGPEAGTTYTVRVYDQADLLMHTESGITGTSYTWTQAAEITARGSLGTSVRVEVWSVRDGLVSWQMHNVLLPRDPNDL